MSLGSDNFLQQYSANGILLTAPVASVYSNGGVVSVSTDTSTQSTGIQNPANDPTQPESIEGGNYNGIFIVGGGQIQSANFLSGSAGWQIMSDGSAEFNNGTFRGTLTANTILVAGITVNQVVTLVRDFTQSSSTNSSTPVKTYSVAAGVLGTNSTLRLTVFVSANTTGGGARVAFGGTDLTGATFGAGASYDIINITNRNSASAQFYSQVFISNAASPSVSSGTLTEDTSSAKVVKLYDAGASGTFTVEGWIVELLR